MAKIYYYRTDEFWRKEQKYTFLEQHPDRTQVDWQAVEPDAKHTWLTEGLHNEFDDFLPIGTYEAKAGEGKAIFAMFSNGVKTNRDAWAYNFTKKQLAQNIQRMIKVYNDQVYKWASTGGKARVDDFVLNDDTQISWSEGLKNALKGGSTIEYNENKLRPALYRPFTQTDLYFDKHINERQYQMSAMFPTSDVENLTICLTDRGSEKPFMVLMTDRIADLHVVGAGCSAQCFPFYTYDEDGSNRRENITDWALEQFRAQYQDDSIAKWDIFHYVYGLLHHPTYRETYAANLRRELPRIPYAPEFWPFAQAGQKLAELHVNYEQQAEYPLQFVENKDEPLNWRVEKMRLSKDKTQLKYNEFLTLAGIPPEVFEYRLGNRSALDWVIDQYRVKTDKRSGIVNDPNNLDDEQYIVRLVGQVITVSLETVRIVKNLPELNLE